MTKHLNGTARVAIPHVVTLVVVIAGACHMYGRLSEIVDNNRVEIMALRESVSELSTAVTGLTVELSRRD